MPNRARIPGVSQRLDALAQARTSRSGPDSTSVHLVGVRTDASLALQRGDRLHLGCIELTTYPRQGSSSRSKVAVPSMMTC